VSAAPSSDYDPFSEPSILDAHACDGALREQAPAVHLERYDLWAIARHEHVQAAQRDWQGLTSTRRPFFDPDAPSIRPNILVTQDPPEHERSRAVLNRVLSPPVLRGMMAEFERAADALLDRVLADARDVVDAQRDIAAPFVLEVFLDALGLPADGREHLAHFGDAAFNAFGPDNEIRRRGMRRGARAIEWVDQNTSRASVTPGTLGWKIFEAADRGEVTELEAQLLVRTLFAAGVESTIALLGHMLRAFAENPQQYAAVCADAGRIPGAIEETLRYEAPLRFSGRGATRDLDVGGITIPAGARVMLMMLAAGRDPRRWDRPDVFDVQRPSKGHVSLGTGIHACVGQGLARVEARALLAAVTRRIERIELAGEPRRAINFMAHGHEHIPVQLVTR
jgi:cytochrome P450